MPRHYSRQNARQQRSRAGGTVRIIGGEWRGRVIAVTEAEGLRPTGNRLRETLFNWLQFDLSGRRCLDLYAGTGALGLEALSRGAAHCTFIEADTRACERLEAACGQLSAGARARVQRGRAESFLAACDNEAFQIVFVDPPFAANSWAEIAAALARPGLLAAGALVYIERPHTAGFPVPEGWRVRRSKTAGAVTVDLFEVGGGPGEHPVPL